MTLICWMSYTQTICLFFPGFITLADYNKSLYAWLSCLTLFEPKHWKNKTNIDHHHNRICRIAIKRHHILMPGVSSHLDFISIGEKQTNLWKNTFSSLDIPLLTTGVTVLRQRFKCVLEWDIVEQESIHSLDYVKYCVNQNCGFLSHCLE